MFTNSFGVAVVPKDGSRTMTGPMTLAALALLAAAAVRITGFDRAGLAFCYFKALTGYACFTCGATRAFGHLARLDVLSAFAIQPLLTVGILAVLAWGLLDALLLTTSRRTLVRLEGRPLRVVAVVTVVIATLNWLYLVATGV